MDRFGFRSALHIGWLSGALLLIAASTVFAVLATRSHGTTSPDYLSPVSSSVCSLPVAQRTGGWVCP